MIFLTFFVYLYLEGSVAGVAATKTTTTTTTTAIPGGGGGGAYPGGGGGHYIGGSGGIHSIHGGSGYWIGKPQPYFAALPTNLTIVSTNSAMLTCRVHMLGDRSVTWMRLKDLHILTVGQVTYTADDRFQVHHEASTGDWTLQVRRAQVTDSGAYVCQVNASPKIVRRVYLTVTDKEMLESLLKQPSLHPDTQTHTHIPGNTHRYIQEGSSLSLSCLVKHPPLAPPPTIAWYRGATLLLYSTPGARLSLQVERERERTTSHLSLHALESGDSGVYTCIPVGGAGASVHVHVTHDERSSAVQWEGVSGGVRRGEGGGGAFLLPLLLFLLLLFLQPPPPPPLHLLSIFSTPSRS
ncbi:zwei Ig domain protein zig-8-like [Eriocheir sinensis]|uniref:zwei Ig domain protein zig-8-like n=1 Tax=Eriocheir sinensis TaxID=95602 RepID=UPI0021C920C4|nr:zwei Ig domain protein zig-8-like [Eriocheir sinensis]